MTTPRSKGRGGRPWRRIREHVLNRDRYVCQIRGPRCTRYATQVDHITPLTHGGDPHSLVNLRAACAACNCAGGAQIVNARRGRGYVPRPLRQQPPARRRNLLDPPEAS